MPLVQSDDLSMSSVEGFVERLMKTKKEIPKAVDELWFVDASLGDLEFWHLGREGEEITPEGPHYPGE